MRKRRHLKLLLYLGRASRALPGAIGNRIRLHFEKNIPHLHELFDPEYYLKENGDVVFSGMDPLHHYILYGSKERRDPSPLFDTTYYMEQAAIPSSFPLSPLAHFLLIGRHRRISPTPWFDFTHYERCVPEITTRRMCPFVHFVRRGLKANRQSCAHFDPQAYLSEHPEVPPGTPALLHFLENTREGYFPSGLETSEESCVNGQDKAVEAALMRCQPMRISPAMARVHVIIPVHDGYHATLHCLHSVLSSRNETPFLLTLIDDCSPDPQLSERLEELSGQLKFTYMRHKQNMGFVQTVNEGFRLHPHLDVVILNADTEVHGDWLDRLCRAARARKNVATVTPLSNNATICSYPEFLKNNAQPLELSPSELDSLAARVNKGMYVEAPTGVGFCMYISRQALERIGPFNAEAFGRGYGEENDFCQRAEALGFVNLLSADTFVRHVGGVSFRAEKMERQRRALRAVNRLHPGYDAKVQDFIRRDPLKKARENLDLARLKRLKRSHAVLFLGLTRGGGAELSMHQHMLREKDAGKSVFILLHTGQRSRVRLTHLEAGALPNISPFDLDLETERNRLAALLRTLEVRELQLHHLIELSAKAPGSLLQLCQQADIPYHFHVHDYLSICPRINLIDDSKVYCGEKGIEHCRACLKGFSFKGESVDIIAWRQVYGALLRGAKRVITPSHDACQRLLSYFPGLQIEVRPHEAPVPCQVQLHRKTKGRRTENLHVAVLGAVGKPKGSCVLWRCARYARKSGAPVRFSVIGYTDRDQQLKRQGVHITGPYTDDHVQERIAEIDPDCIFLPSVWPETYSYTLSHALRSGRPIIAFNIGAMAERLQQVPHALLLPLELHDKPRDIIRCIREWWEDLPGILGDADRKNAPNPRRGACACKEDS